MQNALCQQHKPKRAASLHINTHMQERTSPSSPHPPSQYFFSHKHPHTHLHPPTHTLTHPPTHTHTHTHIPTHPHPHPHPPTPTSTPTPTPTHTPTQHLWWLVTGSAHAMLGPYWAEVLGKSTLLSRQYQRSQRSTYQSKGESWCAPNLNAALKHAARPRFQTGLTNETLYVRIWENARSDLDLKGTNALWASSAVSTAQSINQSI